MKLLIIFTILFSNLSFASEVDYKEFSRVLIKVSTQLSAANKNCGSDSKNVSYKAIENGLSEYHFLLEKKGHGRLGNTIYKRCDLTLVVDFRPTYYDGAAIYDLQYKVLPIKPIR